jgi:hypothetical protein
MGSGGEGCKHKHGGRAEGPWRILSSVGGRRLRMLNAGAFLLGFALLIAGWAVQVFESEWFGSAMLGVGGLLCVGSRFVARRKRLPAP